MKVILVHGWSVHHTNTYGGFPEWLSKQKSKAGQPFDVSEDFLSKYISFDDTVTLDDVCNAFDFALQQVVGNAEKFACITHSTGGPVIRNWMTLRYGKKLQGCRLTHLIMLAPANHGSALAQLGKGRVGRIQAVTEGVEPGQKILDWLELGSDGQWDLNSEWLDYDCVAAGIFPFVLTGQSIDRKLYDFVNSYTDEEGSDGVVRVAAANMNYSKLRLKQTDGGLKSVAPKTTKRTALAVLRGRSHSGKKMGIIRSVTPDNADTHPTAQNVLKCLSVTSARDYARVADEFDQLTKTTQDEAATNPDVYLHREYFVQRYAQIVFRFVDDFGTPLTDYELLFTAGPDYSPDKFPAGFFVDRQRNQLNPSKLTYYLNYDKIAQGIDSDSLKGKLGFTLLAHPQRNSGRPVFYDPVDYHSTFNTLKKYLVPNQTLMVEFNLHRHIDTVVFQLTDNLTPASFSAKPTGQDITPIKPRE
jgi:hypothetical protein